MPLRVELKIRDDVIPLPDLNAGDPPGSMTDRNPDNPHFVVFRCNADDSGGSVSRMAMKNSETADLGNTRAIVGESEPEADIVRLGHYERPIITTRGLGFLMLTHYE